MKKIILSISLCIALICCLSSCIKVYINGSDYNTSEENAQSDTSPKENIKVSLPEPSNGYIFEDMRDTLKTTNTAPLTVTTNKSGGYYFVIDPISIYWEKEADELSNRYLKLRAEMYAEYTYIKFYARADSTVEIEIPWGEYEIYYATGENWCGEDELFGEDTVYAKCDKTFVFSDNGTESLGWTLKLTPTINGNLDVDNIDAEEFPIGIKKQK